jgi:alpha-amylase
MDYETFGEHQWPETGIFDFLAHLPDAVLKMPGYEFLTPSEVSQRHQAVATLDVPTYTSWADKERDTSAWLGNHLQDASAASVYALEKRALATKDEELIHLWSKLQTSDHFYYMATKWLEDGAVHKYFNPYSSPYDAFIYFANAVNELRWRLDELDRRKKDKKRLVRRTRRPKLVPQPTPLHRQPSVPGLPALEETAAL